MAVVNKASDELKEIRKQNMEEVFEYRKYLYNHPKLYHLFLEVTSRCNARCEHCGSSCGYEKPKNEVSKEKLMETLKEVADHYNASEILLNVTGGEPFLRKDLFEIMDYAVSLGFHWGITSNGILIDEELVLNGFSEGDAYISFLTHDPDLDNPYMEESGELIEESDNKLENLDGSTAYTTDDDPYKTYVAKQGNK